MTQNRKFIPLEVYIAFATLFAGMLFAGILCTLVIPRDAQADEHAPSGVDLRVEA